ncbi:MAG: DUF3488 and transglutaminase-like domain-containing protein [Micropruina sp.]|uniref:transglutaminase family protein n=1 Tax=Micropruina sp. TaxID=2737536 RepID=UPI0039E6D0A6
MKASDLLRGSVALAMTLSLTGLTPVTADRGLIGDCLVLIAVIAVVGIAARRLIRGRVLAGAVQAGAAAVTLVVLAFAAGLPSVAALPRVLADGMQWTVMSTAPMGPNLGVRLIATTGIGMLAYLADQLAVVHEQAAWTLLPIGIPYLLTALALPERASFGALLWLAAGYLLVLLADTAGRVPGPAISDRPVRALLSGGLVCLLAAASVAVVAGLATPGVDPQRGTPFAGRGPIQMGDPSLDLRRNLQQPVDQRVLTYTTSTGDGVRLRLTALPAFDATGFHLRPIDLFSGGLPAPPGVASGRPRFQISVTVGAFNSEWLPLPYAPAEFKADGDWRHDPLSMSVLATGDQRTSATNGLRYDATIIDVTPTAQQVSAATAGTPADVDLTTALPDDLPDGIRELAQRITRRGTTDGRRALLIQDWLRSPAFSYSLDPAPGSGYETLSRFLFGDHIGYCEQFAASMAVLARAVGIPARVAVGFLPGTRRGDGWEVRIRNMHAWPELYFTGLGWVAFEPTPAVAQPPGYAGGGPETTAPQTPSTTPSTDVEEPSTEPQAPPPSPEPAAPAPQATDGSWSAWAAGGAALIALAASAPSLIRRRRRARRLTAPPGRAAVSGAWDEVRDSVWDAGAEWPRGSARQIAAALAASLPTDAAAALERIALLVERARYAETLGDVADLTTEVELVRAGLAADIDRRRRWGRVLLPRSLWRRLRWRG